MGGLPVERRWPYEYKAGFAPHDVIEEYTRPSRIVRHGQVVQAEALSDPELLDFPNVGTLEAFNTDGLRSLIDTLDVPDMCEKTMRYPGHIALMKVFRETGFFSKQLITVGDVQVRPLDVTAALLFPKWTFEPGEQDITVMRVTATGQRQGKSTQLVWDLLDRYDPKTDFRSMSRTTALPATITARAIADGDLRKPGVHPPEILAPIPGFVDRMLAALGERGVRYRFTDRELGRA